MAVLNTRDTLYCLLVFQHCISVAKNVKNMSGMDRDGYCILVLMFIFIQFNCVL